MMGLPKIGTTSDVCSTYVEAIKCLGYLSVDIAKALGAMSKSHGWGQ